MPDGGLSGSLTQSDPPSPCLTGEGVARAGRRSERQSDPSLTPPSPCLTGEGVARAGRRSERQSERQSDLV